MSEIKDWTAYRSLRGFTYTFLIETKERTYYLKYPNLLFGKQKDLQQFVAAFEEEYHKRVKGNHKE